MKGDPNFLGDWRIVCRGTTPIKFGVGTRVREAAGCRNNFKAWNERRGMVLCAQVTGCTGKCESVVNMSQLSNGVRRSPEPKSFECCGKSTCIAAPLLFLSRQTIMSRFFRQAADSDSESSDSEESLLSSDDDASKPTAPAKPAMSRFLRTANASDSSSSSESESEDEDDSEDEGSTHKEAKPKSRFLRDSDEEESDEEIKRVVKSARDKRLEEMEATGKAMDNALKINDWIAISSGNS